MLHIYRQLHSHSEAWVVGTTEALRELRDAIDKAIASEEAVASASVSSDGEGYVVLIAPFTDQQMGELRPPSVVGTSRGKVPFEVLGADRYRKLLRGL